jgi:HEAT repeat protein
MMKISKILAVIGMTVLVVGCSQGPMAIQVNDQDLAGRAREVLITASHSESPLLRSHAIEALAEAKQSSAVNLVVAGLSDEYWGVRFTACMAVLEMRYQPAKSQLEKMVTGDPNKSVRAAAAGALHVMGETRFTSLLGASLFDKDVIVRRNTATVLGRMGEPGACKLLKSAAIRDEDLSVKLQAVEAMAILGDTWAQRLMVNNCRSVFDDERILAMMALARAKVEAAGDTFAYIYEKSSEPDRLGMRLVAARALAMLGDYRGRNVAEKALSYQADDPEKSATIRKLAAMALGEMNEPSSLAALQKALEDRDPDVRITAALAILKITRASMSL